MSSKLLTVSILMVAICGPFSAAVHAEEKAGHDHHNHDHHDHDHGPRDLTVSDDARIFSCNLIRPQHQCREYPIEPAALSKTEPLREGCESMGGQFEEARCPTENRIGRCTNSVYNPHDPESVIYSNHYYASPGSRWDVPTVKRVCGNLEAEYVAD